MNPGSSRYPYLLIEGYNLFLMRGILTNKNHMKKDQSGSIISFFPLKYYVNFYVKTTITKKIEEL